MIKNASIPSNLKGFSWKPFQYTLFTICLLVGSTAFGQDQKVALPFDLNDKNISITAENNHIFISSEEDMVVSAKLVEHYLNEGKNVVIQSKRNIAVNASIVSHSQKSNSLHFICSEKGEIVLAQDAKIKSKVKPLNVLFKTNGNIRMEATALVQTHGGAIQLQAFEPTLRMKRNATSSTLIDGILDASAVYGGKITIESDEINIGATAKVLSTGDNGGGKILIGGDWQGGTISDKRESEAIYESIGVHVAEGALIDASAKLNGNGGKVVVWSNVEHPKSNTEVKGELLAMGGKYAGKGGMIETSGGAVDFEKVKVSTIASDGSAGEWLIDPWNFYFNASQLAVLSTNLASNNVTIATSNSTATGNPNIIFGRGHIVFQSNLNYTSSNQRTLTLTSNEDIWINGNIDASTSGGLSLVFNAPSGKEVFIDGDIATNGGSISVNNNATIHFQKISGTQTINTNGGAVSFGSSNVKLLRHSGSLVLNSGAGSLGLGGSGSIEQINTFYQIGNQTNIGGWGNRHANGTVDYGSNSIVSGREYTVRLWYWDSWDGETGGLRVSGNTYFSGTRNHTSGFTSSTGSFGTQFLASSNSASFDHANWVDQYVDITFLAQHTGTLQTYAGLDNDVSDESIQIQYLTEIQFPTTAYNSGSRSLELKTTSGQLTCGTKTFSDLSALTVETNHSDISVQGLISGATSVTKKGTGLVRFLSNNTNTGNTTIDAGTLVLRNDAPNPSNKVFNGTGQLTIEPASASFTTAFTTSGWTFNSTLTGLTLGKINNGADVTVGSTTTIAGPITIYGKIITANENLNTTSGGINGDILLKASSNIIQASGKSFTTNNGDVTLWSDSDGNGSGYIQLAGGSNSGISSGGGNVFLGGGSDLATGYARGAAIIVLNVYTSGVHLSDGTTINSGGGNITLRGQNVGNSDAFVQAGIMGINTTLDAGTGKIALVGLAGGSGQANSQGISRETSNSWIIRSSNPDSDAISLIGDASSTNNSGTSLGINFMGKIESTGGGGIYMYGKTGTATNYKHGLDIRGEVLANSGNITLVGENDVASQIGLFFDQNSSIGSKVGTNVLSSASDIVLKSNNLFFNNSTAINTSGEVSLLPLDAYNSFGVAQTIGSNTQLSSNVSGLTIGKPTNSANITVASPNTIAGPISIYGGTVALNQNIESSNGSTITLFANTLTIPSDKTVKSASGQLIVAPQSTLNTATIGLAGATGTLQLPATYFSTNFVDGFSEIQIGTSNHSGAIATNAFTLRDNMSFLTSGSLTLGFTPVLGTNNVTLGNAISSIIGIPSYYFRTDTIGKVIRTISIGTSLLFPVGKTSYNPVTITNNTGASDVFSARVLNGAYMEGLTGSAITTTVLNRTWDISKTNANAGTGVNFVFNWNNGEIANGSFSAPKMNHYSSTTSNWEVPIVTSTTFGTNALTVVGYTGTFSPFTIAEGSSALPVELTAFNANCTENATTINWQTASEHNSATFEVEKSRDGSNWSLIESIQAAGNSTTLVDYTVVDSENASDVVYYRLKQIDQDGASKIYGPISANCFETIDFTATVFPNPTTEIVTVEMNSPIAQTVSIQICGSEGKAIVQMATSLEEGTTQIPLSIETLKAGVYSVQVNGENATQTIKLVVQ